MPTQGGRTGKLPGQQQGSFSYYSGYSKQFLPYREKLACGQVDDVQQLMAVEEAKARETAKTDADFSDKLRLIGLMERASLALQTNDADKAIEYCRFSQELIEERESESYASEALSSIGSLFVDFLGAGEYGRYDAPGYEKVLLLDIAAMAYLLNGDERAFNVARLAIQWQDNEKEKFEEELLEASKEEEKNRKTDKSETKQKSDSLFAALDLEFSKYDDVALEVPNAFVNPFGDYVTGMVNEFKSVKIKSLLSNAHIAYKQALKLNPESKVLQQAVKDTKKKKTASRLIHVVALDGFVPEKKVLSIPIYRDLDVELPTYEPVASRVATIKVATMKGKVLATLSPVANVKAMALRHQKDSLPAIQAMVVASTIRDIAVVETGNELFHGLGSLVRTITDTAQEPDTTSWMSLPSSILAARFYSQKGLKKLKICSYDNKGKKLAEQAVKLNEGSRHFVLVRSIDKQMSAYPGKKIWTPKS
ncbi:MAG: hypothetical protein U9R57_14590 [Thermodesulfobacteriota bacterium]|nr:hypothetical protein [Thermodesulfobacteriota bacterium]